MSKNPSNVKGALGDATKTTESLAFPTLLPLEGADLGTTEPLKEFEPPGNPFATTRQVLTMSKSHKAKPNEIISRSEYCTQCMLVIFATFFLPQLGGCVAMLVLAPSLSHH